MFFSLAICKDQASATAGKKCKQGLWIKLLIFTLFYL